VTDKTDQLAGGGADDTDFCVDNRPHDLTVRSGLGVVMPYEQDRDYRPCHDDTTVVEADVAYPTDSGLLARAIATMARTVGPIRTS
jgi:hypothetical protein